MICFLLESRKRILDYIVKLHDQFMTDVVRKAKNTYEKQHRKRRGKQKKAMKIILSSVGHLLDWHEHPRVAKKDFWKQINVPDLQWAYRVVSDFNAFTNRGYGHFVLTRYPCLLYTSPSPRDATLSRMPSSA